MDGHSYFGFPKTPMLSDLNLLCLKKMWLPSTCHLGHVLSSLILICTVSKVKNTVASSML